MTFFPSKCPKPIQNWQALPKRASIGRSPDFPSKPLQAVFHSGPWNFHRTSINSGGMNTERVNKSALAPFSRGNFLGPLAFGSSGNEPTQTRPRTHTAPVLSWRRKFKHPRYKQRSPRTRDSLLGFSLSCPMRRRFFCGNIGFSSREMFSQVLNPKETIWGRVLWVKDLLWFLSLLQSAFWRRPPALSQYGYLFPSSTERTKRKVARITFNTKSLARPFRE